MKKLTTLTYFLPLALLNGCASPKPVVKSLDVAMNCSGQSHSVILMRDMSAITIDGKTTPLYLAKTAVPATSSAMAQPPAWSYRNAIITVEKDNNIYADPNADSAYTYNISYGGSHGIERLKCKPSNNDSLPVSVDVDYLSPSAKQDNVERMREQNAKVPYKAKGEVARKADNQKRYAKVEKQCNVYASDLAARTSLKQVSVMSAEAMGNLTACILMAKDGVYGRPTTLRITGNGDNYQYQQLN